MAVKSNANIGFEKELWDAAKELWGAIPAADYRKVIVGLKAAETTKLFNLQS